MENQGQKYELKATIHVFKGRRPFSSLNYIYNMVPTYCVGSLNSNRIIQTKQRLQISKQFT